jgi:ubiquinone/menaquinone biosynthesis C-methylase UbiE
MSDSTDRQYLLHSQYRNGANLNARIQLHARFSTNKYGWYNWLFDQFDLPATASILEVGCGTGQFWAHNAHRVPPGWSLTLTDLSPGMIAAAGQNLSALADQVTLAVVDAQELPYAEASFDAVVANHMLYHVPDRRKTLGEIRRVLKPGGCLYASTVGAGHMAELDTLLWRFDPNVQMLDEPRPKAFLLENGRDDLEPWFERVQLRIYEDELLVTEVEPLLAYLLSTLPQEVQEARRDDLAAFVAGELARQGAVHLTKSQGLFLAC